ncbi:MAG: hypothetical protein UY72_C0003G0008 [Candidatus Uhrbacteria bacterium GW2011_GWD2_52_7]|uniref:Nudix hydrolase domain-containing protein n=1 Tax=Candidatus Uhrbacteria bacterium GW2011_GWD2_52_7 TaxID=1618989 RepID=A0A0G2AE96_9BACT|nr:MAG: hypothetical protein UY72_C0003G0008 [Candidatus Uhrbacteria bacterium GW2011_GWD2_52_7]
MSARINSRVVTFDPDTQKVLLVRNKDQDYWYPPGGGWEPGEEDIRTCGEREVAEETGQRVTIQRLIYTQQFQASPEVIFLEWFWLAHPDGDTKIRDGHIDLHGIVAEARWFSSEELQSVKVFPKRLKTTFWDNLSRWNQDEDPFLGVS